VGDVAPFIIKFTKIYFKLLLKTDSIKPMLALTKSLAAKEKSVGHKMTILGKNQLISTDSLLI
jgi:hypothetical protein